MKFIDLNSVKTPKPTNNQISDSTQDEILNNETKNASDKFIKRATFINDIAGPNNELINIEEDNNLSENIIEGINNLMQTKPRKFTSAPHYPHIEDTRNNQRSKNLEEDNEKTTSKINHVPRDIDRNTISKIKVNNFIPLDRSLNPNQHTNIRQSSKGMLNSLPDNQNNLNALYKEMKQDINSFKP